MTDKEAKKKEKRGHEYVLSPNEINKFSLRFVVIILALTIVPFTLIWGWNTLFSKPPFLELFILFILGIMIHELIHGITWACCAKNSFRSIKFGFLWEGLMPYCHCKESLPVKQYIIGAALPTIILGILPAIYALCTGNILALWFSVVLLFGGAGDAMIIRKLWPLDHNMQIMDHPSKPGFYIPDENGVIIQEKEIVSKKQIRINWKLLSLLFIIGIISGVIGYLFATK